LKDVEDQRAVGARPNADPSPKDAFERGLKAPKSSQFIDFVLAVIRDASSGESGSGDP
jgi:hypothetical protein